MQIAILNTVLVYSRISVNYSIHAKLIHLHLILTSIISTNIQ